MSYQMQMLSPSIGLIKFWEKDYHDTEDMKFIPGWTIRFFGEEDELEGFIGYEVLIGLHGFSVMQIYPDTDSRVYIYELDQKLYAFPFSDYYMYTTDKNIEDLIELIDNHTDPDILFEQMFHRVGA